MRRDIPPEEQGMILINVLLFVAIASGLVLLMISREQMALDRSLRIREAARADAIVRGGELSAVSALRQDLAIAPDVDHGKEPWAGIAEAGAKIDGGTFALAVGDAQGRFNLNNLRELNPIDLSLFFKIADATGLTAEQRGMVIAYVKDRGPITDLRPLALSGMDAERVARLERLVTALPDKTKVNLNSAPPELIALMFPKPDEAAKLTGRLRDKGFLTQDDLKELGVYLPFNAQLTSRDYWVHTRVQIGDTVQQSAALIQRSTDKDGNAHATIVARWLNAAVPPGVPEFPKPR